MPTASPDLDPAPPQRSILTQPLSPRSGAGSGAPSGPAERSSPDRPGFDRPRTGKPRVTRRRVALAVLALGAIVAAWFMWGRNSETTFRTDREALTVRAVEEGPFQEYVSLAGTVRPLRTVYIDAVVGGQVVRRYVDEGDTVRVGQPMFQLQNDETTLQVMASEAQIEEQVSTIRQGRLALDQNQLDLEQQIAELDYETTRLRRSEARAAALVARGAEAPAGLEELRDELNYANARRDLTLAAHQNDQAQRRAQIRDMEASIRRLRENLAVVRSARDDLVVRAPVTGQFSALEAEVGELKTRGSRLGQIDVLDEALVRASIDEFYLSRVVAGQTASTEVDDVRYDLRVRTVYPEVGEGQFEVELVFDGPTPEDLRRGQTLRMRLELGDPEPAVLLPRGAFYNETGGRWAYVLAADGAAVRRPIELGRQNPRHYEVLSGLAPGDRVVVSSYASLGEAERLVFD